MAKRPSKKTTALATYDEKFAAYAKKRQQEEPAAAGQFFSLRGGQLTFNDAVVEGNQMAVIVLDAVHENCFYKSKFNPEVITAPDCYAFGRKEDELVPHPEAPDKQNPTCAGCRHNVFGSGEGRGKACSNRRRLAMISAGTFDKKLGEFRIFENPKDFESDIAFLKLPVTSVKGFKSFVRKITDVMNRPEWGVFTKVSVESDPRSQFRVNFEVLDLLPPELFETVEERASEAQKSIIFPYMKGDSVEASAPKKPSSRKSRKKY